MFGLIRNATVIGLIAWHSPVHTDTPEHRLAALQGAPAGLVSQVQEAAPRLAAQAILSSPAAIEAFGREALKQAPPAQVTAKPAPPRP